MVYHFIMSKEITEKKKANPLVYLVGIPAGILILVLAYNLWQRDKIYRNCAYSKFPTTKCTLILGSGR